MEIVPIVTRIVTPELLSDLEALFDSNDVTRRCWCMWFIIPVKAYHAGGGEENRLRFEGLAASSPEPMGVLAYVDGRPVGWCAVGPRRRYARAILTPTYRGRDPGEDDSVWLVPCFFIKPEARRLGVGRALLERAAVLAGEHGAVAIEGFPTSGDRRHSSGDFQAGRESVFQACGFVPVRRPSDQRVVMRRDL